MLTIGDTPSPWGASWAGDDVLFGQGPAGIWRVPAAGGTPERIIEVAEGEVAHGPQLLPGGEWVLFTFGPVGAALWREAQIVAQSVTTGERVVLIDGGRDARYLPTGHLVYADDEVILAAPFDVERRQVTGGSVPLVEGATNEGVQDGAAQFAISDTGSLVYVPSEFTSPGQQGRSLVWVDREGRETPALSDSRFGFPNLSPDDRKLAVTVGDDIWIRDFESGVDTRLTEISFNVVPLWTPDGTRVTFTSNRSGLLDVYSRPIDRSEEAVLLVTSPTRNVAGGWSPDGETLIYSEGDSYQRDLWTRTPGGQPTPFLTTEFNERGPRISPDGRWVTYISDQAGEDRIYVQPFPEGGRVVPVSTGLGTEPVWARDGSELYYRNGGQMFAVPVVTEPAFALGRPQVLFADPYEMDPGPAGLPNYDVSLDGRFLMVTSGEGDVADESITVVLNWFEELKARVPTN